MQGVFKPLLTDHIKVDIWTVIWPNIPVGHVNQDQMNDRRGGGGNSQSRTYWTANKGFGKLSLTNNKPKHLEQDGGYTMAEEAGRGPKPLNSLLAKHYHGLAGKWRGKSY